MSKSNSTCPRCDSDSADVSSGYDRWLSCDACQLWYHVNCLDVEQVDMIKLFHCPQCVETHGPSTIYPKQRKSGRSQARLNYADLNEGTAAGDERIWRKLLNVKKFRNDHFKRYKAKEVTMELIRSNGMKEPFVVEENEPELKMKMPPPDISVHTIAELVGKDTPIDVIDVASQSEVTGWTLSRWANYFHSPERDRIRNVISLEISDTKLAEQIVRPKIVRDIDWIDQMWPESEAEYPKVQLYCLMGTKDSYTDFHIDFGGSSVFYHILRGSKRFYFIEPTPKNLKKYQKWSSSPDQSTTFLGDLVKECYCMELKPGNTMIIPTGWIHAVFTPEDAIVIGGNFLHTFNVATQLKIHDIEEATNVPRKFRFPFYKKINWYTLEKYDIWLSGDDKKIFSDYELGSIVALAQFLRKEVKSDFTLGTDSKMTNTVKKSLQIPECIQDPIKLTYHAEELAKNALIEKEEGDKKEEEPKPKLFIRLTLPQQLPQPPQQDDYEYEEEEVDEELEEEFDEDDDDEYQEDPNTPVEYNTIPAISHNNHTIKTENNNRKRKKSTIVIESEEKDSSSDDDDSMGTRKSKSTKSSALFSNRKRSLSNNSNSSQPSTAKQRILGMINKRH